MDKEISNIQQLVTIHENGEEVRIGTRKDPMSSPKWHSFIMLLSAEKEGHFK